MHADDPWGEAVSRETVSGFDSRKRISMQTKMTVPGYPYPMCLGRHPAGWRVGSEVRSLPRALGRQPVPGGADPSGRSSTVLCARMSGP